jgi:hypothetical protein
MERHHLFQPSGRASIADAMDPALPDLIRRQALLALKAFGVRRSMLTLLVSRLSFPVPPFPVSMPHAAGSSPRTSPDKERNPAHRRQRHRARFRYHSEVRHRQLAEQPLGADFTRET